MCCVVLSCSVVSDSLRPHGLYSLPGSSVHGDSPGKNTRVGFYALLLGIFPTQESNSGLLHCRQILYRLSHEGSPSKGDKYLEFSNPSEWLFLPPRWVSHRERRRRVGWILRLGLTFLYILLMCVHAQSCLTLGSLPGSSVPGILQARTGVGCHFLLIYFWYYV